jgi:hypothetical protein
MENGCWINLFPKEGNLFQESYYHFEFKILFSAARSSSTGIGAPA